MQCELLHHDESARREGADDLLVDLKADTLLRRMANGDAYLLAVCGRVLSTPLTAIPEILRRQALLRELTGHGAWLADCYAATREARMAVHSLATTEYRPWQERVAPSDKKIGGEVERMRNALKCLRTLANRSRNEVFTAEPLRAFARQLTEGCTDTYLDEAERRLQDLDSLRTEGGDAISMRLGDGLKWSDTVVNGMVKSARRPVLWRRKPAKDDIPLDNVNLSQNAAELLDVSLRPVYVVLAAVNEAMERYCESVGEQLGFFLGCTRLYESLQAMGAPCAYPVFSQDGTYRVEALMDAHLVAKDARVCTANTIDITKKRLVLVSGRNQGGKTTFLRSVGLAQLMAQSGMFVIARFYVCPCYTGIFAHFPSSEDEQLKSGLLDAELKKLSAIIDHMRPGSLLLMNETFQTTTDDAAKELADEIVLPLCGEGVTVLFVTHLYTYAKGVWDAGRADTLFLSPDPSADSADLYRLRESEPQATASGEALYQKWMTQ